MSNSETDRVNSDEISFELTDEERAMLQQEVESALREFSSAA